MIYTFELSSSKEAFLRHLVFYSDADEDGSLPGCYSVSIDK